MLRSPQAGPCNSLVARTDPRSPRGVSNPTAPSASLALGPPRLAEALDEEGYLSDGDDIYK